ncbi:MAG TPA: dihydroorotate dehydrogenase [Phycisphaerae bacterium]|nr:dihydroorotate dehydrogenase [Phycisphaerae bacterium]HRY68813.1 dihydroorotate dehydrogenase [Phycisphaerae bacterium]
MTPVDLTTHLGSLTLRNPVVTLSGTCGYGDEYAPFMDLSRLGAFTTKSVTLTPRRGNAPPRVVETACGMLNAIGLANVGLDRFLADKLPVLVRLGVPVLVNVAGHTVDEYVAVAQALDARPEIAGLELNVSCPNVADGLTFGTSPEALRDLVLAVRSSVKRSLLIVKLSPNVTDITRTAAAAIDAGADCLSMINTLVGMAINIETRRPILANVTGGLSGPAIKPLALNLVHRVYRQVAGPAGIPIIGMGGIASWRDAVEFLLAGASAVGIGTALFIDPTTPLKVLDGLETYLRQHRLASVTDLVGGLRL